MHVYYIYERYLRCLWQRTHQSSPPPPEITTTPPTFTPTFVLTVMSAPSRHSPAKRKNPENQEWRTVGASRRPQAVGNPEWACPNHGVCSGFIATRLRNDGKTHFGHCDQQIYKDASTCQVSCSILKKTKDSRTPAWGVAKTSEARLRLADSAGKKTVPKVSSTPCTHGHALRTVS